MFPCLVVDTPASLANVDFPACKWNFVHDAYSAIHKGPSVLLVASLLFATILSARTKPIQLARCLEQDWYPMPVSHLLEVIGDFVDVWHHFGFCQFLCRLGRSSIGASFNLLEQGRGNGFQTSAREAGWKQPFNLLIKAEAGFESVISVAGVHLFLHAVLCSPHTLRFMRSCTIPCGLQQGQPSRL